MLKPMRNIIKVFKYVRTAKQILRLETILIKIGWNRLWFAILAIVLSPLREVSEYSTHG